MLLIAFDNIALYFLIYFLYMLKYLEYHLGDGFKIKSKELKLSHYADDRQILLDGSENSIRNVVKLLDSYTEISGLKVSYEKPALAPLGKSRMEMYTHNFPIGMTITLHKIKSLEITYSDKWK